MSTVRREYFFSSRTQASSSRAKIFFFSHTFGITFILLLFFELIIILLLSLLILFPALHLLHTYPTRIPEPVFVFSHTLFKVNFPEICIDSLWRLSSKILLRNIDLPSFASFIQNQLTVELLTSFHACFDDMASPQSNFDR